MGRYSDGAIDVADIAQYKSMDPAAPSQPAATQQGKMMHELREQYGKVISGIKPGSSNMYQHNHERAIGWENSVNGNTCLPDKVYKNGGVIIQSYQLPDKTVNQVLVTTRIPIIKVVPYVAR